MISYTANGETMNANRINIEDINQNIKENSNKLIEESEQFFTAQVNKVANFLMQKREVKFVLLAGPSSSGKTTTSKILSQNLQNNGFDALAISLDDFFVDREQTPLWKDGTYNYETYDAIDWELFGNCMQNLILGKEAYLPIYNFKTGYKEASQNAVKLKDDTIVIIEGLHALNPIVDKYIPKEKSLKVYTSVNTDIYKNKKLFMLKENVRFFRRLIRDLFTRNISIEQTTAYWQKVNLGEELYIRPYIERAQIRIDSFHPYELGAYDNVMKSFSHFSSGHLTEAKKVLEAFAEIDFKLVPKTSVLQEFLPKID